VKRAAAVLCAAVLCAFGVLCIKNEPPRVVFSLVLAVLLHEAGHICALKLAGVGVRRVVPLPFGALIDTGDRLCGYLAECGIYMAGPGASFLGAALAVRGADAAEMNLQFCFCVLSLGLGCFNLLPLPGLDGAGALRAVLLHCLADMNAAERAARAVQAVFTVLFWLASCSLWLIYGIASYPLLLSVFFLLRLFCG